MTAEQAREFLRTVASTQAGVEILTKLGLYHVIEGPNDVGDRECVKAAEEVLAEVDRKFFPRPSAVSPG